MITLIRSAQYVQMQSSRPNFLFFAVRRSPCMRRLSASSSEIVSVNGDQDQAVAGPGPSSMVQQMHLDDFQQQKLEPGLYLVGTPIGNLQDITIRALNVLKSANLILAEDTRHTGKLLSAYGVRTPMASYHQHNEKERSKQIVDRLKGEVLALVSDAGMPGISDPGSVLVQAAIEAGARVVPIPGPCAMIAAVVASGLSTESFTFLGFLPPKQGARRSKLLKLRDHTSTLVFYAPPHGLRAILSDMVEILGGERKTCVARELTKMHEEHFRSTLQGALNEFSSRDPKGEICIVVQGCDPDAGRYAELTNLLQASLSDGNDSQSFLEDARSVSPNLEYNPTATTIQGSGPQSPPGSPLATSPLDQANTLQDALLKKLLGSGMSTKAAAKEAARLIPGISRKDAYAAALKLTDQGIS